MGTDIHFFIEYSYFNHLEDRSRDINTYDFYFFSEVALGRFHEFFSSLEQNFSNRGLPKNTSFEILTKCLVKSGTNSQDSVDLFYNKVPIPIDVKKLKIFNEKEQLYYDSNYHSHSWVLLPELKAAYAAAISSSIEESFPDYKVCGLESTISSMEVLEKCSGCLTRGVFWFSS